MPVSKRLFDVILSTILLAGLFPSIAICAVLIVLFDRQSPFFAAQRMKMVDQPFVMWKLRTMRGPDDGLPTGGHKAGKVTRLGRLPPLFPPI